MKKIVLLLLKIVGGTAVGAVLLAGVGLLLLNTSFVQNSLLQEAVLMLKERLNTEVSIDEIRINLFGQDVSLLGVNVEDQQHRRLLHLEELGVEVDLWPLMRHEVKVVDAKVKGLEANLLKSDSDSVANFQFIVDAFKKKKPARDSLHVTDSVKPKNKLNIDVDRIWLERIKVKYNQQEAQLGSLLFRKGSNGRMIAEIRDLQSAWVQKTKKGPVDTKLSIGLVNILDMKDRRQLEINQLRYITDNRKPRKNANKPKRGFFDVGHFDLTAHLNVRLDHLAKDSVVAVITDMTAVDSVSGIDVRNLKTRVEANKQVAHLKQFSISLPHTTLAIESATLQLPSKKQGRKLAYTTSLIKGRTLLKDISRTFAPVLKNFNEPLLLQLRMSGNDEGMQFRDVRINTQKKDLTIQASGFISGLKDKYKLQVHFDVHRMHAKVGSAERIISQFPVKKYMMKQVNNLGNIDYTGRFDVLWKREQFAGRLTTAVGKLDFNFALDENNKYVLGSVRTDSLHFGKAMDMPDIKKVAFKADFKFDISKPRTAIMRKKVGGKLPMGEVHAEVYEAKYKLLHVRNTVLTLKSNGAIAEGNVNVRGKRVDLLCSFSFTNTNEMKKTKIKPGIKFHGLSDEEKAKREAKKQQEAEEKAARKAAKAEAKAARKAAKEAEDAAKDAEKAARKAAKAEEKAARKAAKAQEKAARKAAKEAEKAARKAAKEAEKD